MNDLDLDIDNYNLKDILNLFSIDCDFDDEDLRGCKKKVLMTHPDKSRLPKEVFLFYCKAYKLLENIYIFKCKDGKRNTEYSTEEQDKAKMEYITHFSKTNDFNKEFNLLFTKHYNKTEHGYGDFLSTTEIEDDIIEEMRNNNLSKQEKDRLFERLKDRKRELILFNEIKECDYNNLTNIDDSEIPDSYGSDLFSKLPFEDLKKAHMESVIPVNNKDYVTKSNLEDLKTARNAVIEPMTRDSAEKKLSLLQINQHKMAVTRAYNLAKETEHNINQNKKFDSLFYKLTN